MHRTPHTTSHRKIPVAVLGATGAVGQRMVSLLAEHPWFEPTTLAASERSSGRPYAEAVHWSLPGSIPERAAGLRLVPAGSPLAEPLVFSALDSRVAGPIESGYAMAGALVVSNTASHRMDAGVPLVIPEVNPGHLDLLETGRGGILTNPNCSTIGLVLALKPLADAFGLRRVLVVTLQAISGAGLPGVPAMEIGANVIPLIDGEEEKLAREPAKILGSLRDGRIEPATLVVSAQCNRVPVLDGHTESVSVELDASPSIEELTRAWREFRGLPQTLELPSAPACPIHISGRSRGPQPRLDRECERGMAIVIGRVQPCPVLGYRFVLVAHNTLRGAAGGAILLGELAAARGLVPGEPPPATHR